MRWSLSVLVAAMFAVVCLLPRGGDSPRAGCLWDRDTLAQEAEGNELIVMAITGRFDRFEPVYYEARLRHLQPMLEAEPTRLDLYDDVGVALDRLHRGDEAIAVMAGKRAQLDLLPEGSAERAEHEYRYLANLGTFHAHRWLRNGKDRGDLSDLQEAERLIAAAIELNPDAHFGRERYQLMAIRWLLDPPEANEDFGRMTIFTAAGIEELGWLGRDTLANRGYTDAAEGIAGLIVLGDGWESIDLYIAIAAALFDREDGHLGTAALLRAEELLADTERDLLVPGVSGDIRSDVHAGVTQRIDVGFVSHREAEELRSWFAAARAEADAWRMSRNQHVAEQVADDQVPEASGDFWNSWTESTSPPEMPDRLLTLEQAVGLLLAAVLLILTLLAAGIWVIWKRRRAATPVAA